jgi:hypothetical protein
MDDGTAWNPWCAILPRLERVVGKSKMSLERTKSIRRGAKQSASRSITPLAFRVWSEDTAVYQENLNAL